MSNEENATFGQASHTLVLVDQQGLTQQQLKVLHSGYLSDVCQAIKTGTIPGRDEFRAVIGLTAIRPKPTSHSGSIIISCTDIGPDCVVVRVRLNRNRTPQQAIKATDRAQYTDRKVVDAMPKGEGDEVEVVFFKPRLEEYTRRGFVSDEDLEKAIVARGLKNDPVAVAAVNEADPDFADKKPHATHWKDTKGNWCSAAFNRWGDERKVSVDRDDVDWVGSWWFAGVRK